MDLVPKRHLLYPTPDDCKILTLPDGRLLSYGEYGSKAPDAHPFLFMHGIPDTRLDACLLPSDQALAEKLNIRWIGIDRPGLGLSTFQPGRTNLGWVDDMKCLIQHLQLKQYRILGVSGGTSYALACAHLLPRSELRSVGIAFGVGPWESGMAGLSVLNRVGITIWKYFPGVFRWTFDRYVVPKVHTPDQKATEDMLRQQMKYMPKEDRKAWQDEDLFQGLVKIHREVYRQGSSIGYVEDSKISTGDWGFDLKDVDYSGVRLWYGSKDVNTTPQQGRYMAARLRDAVYKEYPGKTHFTMWDHIEEILTDMLQDE